MSLEWSCCIGKAELTNTIVAQQNPVRVLRRDNPRILKRASGVQFGFDTYRVRGHL